MLFLGDNLKVLREKIADASIDLVYLDPPFNSNRDYNVLFQEKDGTDSAAQFKAFTDTWRWDSEAALTFDTVRRGGGRPAEALEALSNLVGKNDVLAYLTMMTPRLIELRRVMKPTATIWLHCDPTASHYLKMLMDSVFGPERFLNEVSWKRSYAHSDAKQGMKHLGRIRDVILVYTRSHDYFWDTQFTPYDESYLKSTYRQKTPEGRQFAAVDLTAPKPGGDVEYEWRVKRNGPDGKWEADLEDEFRSPLSGWEYKGVHPYNGKYWAYSKENLREFARKGQLYHRRTGMPRMIYYRDERQGVPLQDSWDDIGPAKGDEDTGFPTQKPLKLLERVVRVGCPEGGTVLDPFCGCGTAILAAEKVGRRWIGIDVTHLAITLVRHRLHDAFGDSVQYEVFGEPTDLAGARSLLEIDPTRYKFQWWALSLIGAAPPSPDRKKGADRGIDGKLYLVEKEGGKLKIAPVSVKSGRPTSAEVRDLAGVVERDKAPFGAFITLEESTREMREEAARHGTYRPEYPIDPNEQYPRIQIRTIEELLGGKKFDYPQTRVAPFREAAPVEREKAGPKGRTTKLSEHVHELTEEE